MEDTKMEGSPELAPKTGRKKMTKRMKSRAEDESHTDDKVEGSPEPAPKISKKKMRKRAKPKSEPEIETVKAWWVLKDTDAEAEKADKEDNLTSIIIKFITKQEQYAIPQVPIAVKENLNTHELNRIVYAYLKKADILETIPAFEFLIGGKLLCTTLGQHLTQEGISFEATTDIEFFERYPPPTPKDNLEHDDWVSSVMSCGNWLLTGCYDNTVQLWSVDPVAKGKGKRAHVLTIPAHKAPVKAVAWIKKEKHMKSFVSCSIDQTSIVWDWDSISNSVECVWECRGHTQSVECLAVEPKGTKFATGSWDKTLKIWDGGSKSSQGAGHDDEPDKKKVKKNKSQRLKTPLMTFGGHSESVSGVCWLDSSQLLSCSWDHSIRLWDLEMEGKISQINGNVAFFCLSYSPLNQCLLAGCADRHIRMYDPRASQGSVVQGKFLGHNKWVPSVRWSTTDENFFVSGGYDDAIRVWDRRNSSISMYDLLGHDDKVLSVDWSHGKHIVSGSADCTAQIYST